MNLRCRCVTAATFHPAGRNSPFSRSPSSAPSATNYAGTSPRRSSSDDLTNSWFASSGTEAGSALAATEKYSWRRVAKACSGRHYIYKESCRVSEASSIAGIRLARERQVNVRVVPTGKAIEESVDLAHEIFNRVFRRVPEKLNGR